MLMDAQAIKEKSLLKEARRQVAAEEVDAKEHTAWHDHKREQRELCRYRLVAQPRVNRQAYG